jgi:predicted nucleotidyltransferase component of viral defense system
MKDVIQERLKTYDPQSDEDEENALKEITQEVALYGLEKSGFFEKAIFQGGTCLRIVHGLDRFSEDLDFVLKEKDAEFDLSKYLDVVSETMNQFGYRIEVSGEEKADDSVKTRFLKDDSIKRLLKFEHKQDLRKKIQIKVEVDINPPSGDDTESNYLDFPTSFMIITHDMPSLLAGKSHALICRTYVKGRDWYDYLWYISKKSKLNFRMLEAAINQLGPWKEKGLEISKEWLHEKLEEKIKSIDWEEAKKDVERFLKPDKKEGLRLWSEDFFLKMTKKLIDNQL